MGSSRQEYWSGLLFHSSENLPDPEIEPMSPLTTEPSWKNFIIQKTPYFTLTSTLRPNQLCFQAVPPWPLGTANPLAVP